MAKTFEVTVPDIGGYDDVPVIEVLVAVGDTVAKDQGLVTLESDKATMDVPADQDGTVDSVLVKIGDRVSQGSPIVMLKAADGEAPVTPPPSVIAQQEPAPSQKPISAPPAPVAPTAGPAAKAAAGGGDEAQGTHASPSVRRLARELVDPLVLDVQRHDYTSYLKSYTSTPGRQSVSSGDCIGSSLRASLVRRAVDSSSSATEPLCTTWPSTPPTACR